MSTSIIPYTYEGRQVRTVDVEGAPWFVAADVAKILGYSVQSAMTRTLDDDEKGVQILHTPGGDQEMTVISEGGLYSAILRSRVEGAREFKRWVTHEVLPAVRQHGAYMTPARIEEVLADPDTIITLALQLNLDPPMGRLAELAS